MPDDLHAIVQRMIDAGESEENIAAVIRQSKAAAPPVTQAAPEPASSGWPAKIGEAVSNLLPAAGGIIGGVFGGPPGAAAGGAAGQGYRQLAQHATEIPGAIVDVARNLIAHPVETAQGALGGVNRGAVDTALQAGSQAAGQAVGDAAVAGAGVMSKWLMNRATSRVSAKLMQEFPELSDILIDNALTVSKGGYGRAYAMLMSAKGQANAALKAADAAGSQIPIEVNGDLAESLKTALLERAVKSGKVAKLASGEPITIASARLDPPTRALFAKIDAALTSKGPLELTPSQADLLKTQLQKESKALYANRGAPNGQKAMGMDATERAEYASRLNDAIDALASGYKDANAAAQPMIGATRGIKQAMRPNGNLYQAMVRPAVGMATGGAIGQYEGGTPGSVLGGLAGAAMTSPAGMSREAILLAHPAVQGVLRQLPKPLAQELMDLLGTRSSGSQ